MSKVQANRFIEDLTTTEKTLGIAGFLSSFFFARFFKNSDDIKKRIRSLETGHEIIKSEHEFIKNTLINVQDQQKNHSVRLLDIDRDLIAIKKDVNHTNNNVKGISNQIEGFLKEVKKDNQNTLKDFIKKFKK